MAIWSDFKTFKKLTVLTIFLSCSQIHSQQLEIKQFFSGILLPLCDVYWCQII